MKRFFSALVSIFFLFIFSSILLAETDTTKVKVEVDRAFATIGDRINFRVTVTHDPKVTVFGIDASEVLGDFETKQATDFSTKEDSQIIEGKNYVVTNYILGEYVIRPFTIQYRTEKGEAKQLKTNSIYITIQSIDKNKDPKSDIRGVKGVRKIKGPIFVWLLLMLLVITGLAGWLVYTHLKKKILNQDHLEPALSPHDEAYQALNRLQHSDLIRRGQIKLYFFQMSEILRRYFERRYSIKALESTTYELLHELHSRLSTEDLKFVDQVLSFCDLAKFAKYEPAPVEVLRQNNDAKLVIGKTKEIAQEAVQLESIKP